MPKKKTTTKTATSPSKTSPPKFIITENLTLKYANLHRPDEKFTPVHQCEFVLPDSLAKKLEEIKKQLGGKKVNGIRERDGDTLMKVKSKVYVEDGRFPCVDSKNKPTEVSPFGGDVVRLKLIPKVVSKDNSVSFYLGGVQIIEKNSSSEGFTGFEEVEDGYTGPTEDTDSAPAEEPEEAVDEEETEEDEDEIDFD